MTYLNWRLSFCLGGITRNARRKHASLRRSNAANGEDYRFISRTLKFAMLNQYQTIICVRLRGAMRRLAVDAIGEMTFVLFTKRTNEPKLAWLEAQLTKAGIAHRRNGSSFHAPILEVDETELDYAWEILTPVDDVLDDDPMFDEWRKAT